MSDVTKCFTKVGKFGNGTRQRNFFILGPQPGRLYLSYKQLQADAGIPFPESLYPVHDCPSCRPSGCLHIAWNDIVERYCGTSNVKGVVF